MSNNKYKEEYCQLLIEHMKNGKSYDSFPATVFRKYQVHIGLSTMYDWESMYPAWKDAKSTAMTCALDFMETRAFMKMSGQKVEGINAKDIDSYVLMGMLKTRFWKIYGDKVQHINEEGNKLKVVISKEESEL